jgi:hypothetical protein
MVGAHNGNVVNNVELRRQFSAEGMIVRSENDGESCVHAVERYTRQGYDMVTAIRMAHNDLEGDYAFVIGKIGEDRLYAIKKGSGLVAGIAADSICIGSDLPSILPITRNILRIEDGEIITFWADGYQIHNVADGSPVERQPEIVSESMESVQKGGYAHFMLKEIHEQAQVSGKQKAVLGKIIMAMQAVKLQVPLIALFIIHTTYAFSKVLAFEPACQTDQTLHAFILLAHLVRLHLPGPFHGKPLLQGRGPIINPPFFIFSLKALVRSVDLTMIDQIVEGSRRALANNL